MEARCVLCEVRTVCIQYRVTAAGRWHCFRPPAPSLIPMSLSQGPYLNYLEVIRQSPLIFYCMFFVAFSILYDMCRLTRPS